MANAARGVYVYPVPLALSASSLRSRFSTGRSSGGLLLTDLPAFVKNELGLTGLLLTTDLLAGADRARLNHILESADKAGCPVLALAESNPLNLGIESDFKADQAIERCMRVAQAAHWMGCSAFSIPVASNDDDESLDLVSDRLKGVARRAEKLDLNLCIAPCEGLTKSPERVGELLKKIGGFRIGTMPDFAAAAQSPDPVAYLRRLVPYASMVLATGTKFEPAVKSGKAKGKGKAAPEPTAPATGATELVHSAYDLQQLASVLISVGFEGPIAIDYRGPGDPIPCIMHIKGVLDRLFKTGVSDDVLLADIVEGDGDLASADDEKEKDV